MDAPAPGQPMLMSDSRAPGYFAARDTATSRRRLLRRLGQLQTGR
jgi:hypothetical protein